MQQSEESAAETEAQRVTGLRLPDQRRIVQRELLQRVPQVGIVVRVDREEAAEDPRLDVPVPGQRLGRPVTRAGQGVADTQRGDLLEAGDDITDLTGTEALDGAKRLI